ncbi:MAG: glutamyl-tRNA reductase [bacterium]
MTIFSIGLNHEAAPVEIREKIYFPPDRIPSLLSVLRESGRLTEANILSTCNRTEVYFASDNGDEERKLVVEFLTREAGCTAEELKKFLYTLTDEAAVKHLFRVASGLDSMVVGEGQVLAQVRKAYEAADGQRALGKVLGTLFRSAVATGKRARAETEISKNAVSVSSAAVELAGTLFGSLGRKTALIIGAGKMSELSIKHLRSANLQNVTVTNRTYEHAVALAEKFHAAVMPFGELEAAVAAADVVISSTGSPQPIVSRTMMQSIMRRRRNRPIFIVDIAVPRDFDPACASVTNCFLYDIDDLKAVVNRNIQERKKEIGKVEQIVEEETSRYMQWYASLGVIPILTGFREKIQGIRDAELHRFESRLKQLSEGDRQLIEQITSSIINKVLHQPTTRLKELQQTGNGLTYADALRVLFGLEAPGEENEK